MKVSGTQFTMLAKVHEDPECIRGIRGNQLRTYISLVDHKLVRNGKLTELGYSYLKSKSIKQPKPPRLPEKTGDEVEWEKIARMSMTELLDYTLAYPEYLNDSYYKGYDTAILNRAKELEEVVGRVRRYLEERRLFLQLRSENSIHRLNAGHEREAELLATDLLNLVRETPK